MPIKKMQRYLSLGMTGEVRQETPVTVLDSPERHSKNIVLSDLPRCALFKVACHFFIGRSDPC